MHVSIRYQAYLERQAYSQAQRQSIQHLSLQVDAFGSTSPVFDEHLCGLDDLPIRRHLAVQTAT